MVPSGDYPTQIAPGRLVRSSENSSVNKVCIPFDLQALQPNMCISGDSRQHPCSGVKRLTVWCEYGPTITSSRATLRSKASQSTNNDTMANMLEYSYQD